MHVLGILSELELNTSASGFHFKYFLQFSKVLIFTSEYTYTMLSFPGPPKLLLFKY